MKKWTLRVLGVLALLYLAAAGIVMPYLIRTKAPEIVAEATQGGKLSIGSASFNPFILRLDLGGVRFETPRGAPLFSVRRFDVNVDIVPLLWGRLSVSHVGLESPRLTIVQDEAGRFNFDWLLRLGTADANATADTKPAAKTPIPAAILHRFELSDGRIDVTDRSRPRPLHFQIAPLGLNLHDIDTRDFQHDGVHLYAGLEGGGLLDLKARLRSLDPVAFSGTLDYDAGRLYTAWHFLQEISGLEVADGRLNLHLSYDVNLSDLNRTTIGDVHLRVANLRVKPKAEHADVLRLRRVSVDGGPIRPLARYARVSQVRIDDTFVALKRLADGSVNWAHYFPRSDADVSAADDTQPAHAQPWDARIAQADIRRLALRFDDAAIRPATHFSLDEFNLSARNISALPQTTFDYDAALRFNTAMRCRFDGNVTHTPLDASVFAQCGGTDLMWFVPYIDAAAKTSLQRFAVALRSGTLGFAAAVRAAETNGSVAVTVEDANATLAKFRVDKTASNGKVFGFSKLRVAGVRVSTADKTAKIASVRLKYPDIRVERAPDGSIDAASLIVPKAAPPKKGAAKASEKPSGNAWSAAVDTVAIEGAHLRFRDRALRRSTVSTIDRFDLTLRHVSTDPKQPVAFTNRFALDGKGSFRTRGTIVRKPLGVQSDFSFKGLALAPLSPYVEERTFAKLVDGSVGTKGHFVYAPSAKKADVSVRGDFRLDDLLVDDTRDGMPLVSMKTLKAEDYFFEMNPDRFFVDTVELDAFYANIVVDRNGTLNLASIMREAPAAERNATTADKNATKPAPFPVRIVRFVVKNGAVHFADLSLPLPFDTQIHDVNGQVLGISSLPEDTTYLRVDGEIDRYGVAKAEGSLNTGDPKAFTDIGVDFRNIDLKSFTPYSGKFVGRAIDGGKLSVGLRYNIVDSKMNGDNALVIRQIALGRDIESNTSVSLPLDFAIALLEDDDGVIDIEMPVDGNVSNPDFKWGGVVWGAFVNLLQKAVTAPFSLIGSMLGIEGDELKYVEFEPGKAVLDAASRERLDMLAKVLKKRPKLGLKVTGTYDAVQDTRALKQSALLHEVLARSGKEKIDAQAALAPALLEPIYVERLGEKALASLKKKVDEAAKDEKARTLRYKEMLITTLVATQPLDDGALAALAKAREQAVRTYLAVSQGIAAERIQSEGPKAVDADGKYVSTELGLDAVE